MTRQETRANAQIDRRRECDASRAIRTARMKALEARAHSVIGCEVADMPEEDRPDFCRFLAGAVRARLVDHMDAPGAASILSREAHEAARGILPQAIAKARAEQLFTTAANDRARPESEA